MPDGSSLVPWLGGALDGLKRIGRGKVREIYDLRDYLLLVATDRISAFDVVLAEGIPQKGRVLTQISEYWFEALGPDHHLVTTDLDAMPASVRAHAPVLEGRSSLVKRARPLAVEFIVRGYLAGSGWSEYRKSGSICGIDLPQGLLESARLPHPILTPTSKAVTGHDENMTLQEVENLIGRDVAHRASRIALDWYSRAHELAATKGIILADTKLELGFIGDRLSLIDEAFTPDSSRFWPMDSYEPGRSQRSFDKQYVRDFLLSTGWNRKPPPPALPEEIVRRTSETYVAIFERLTGRTLIKPRNP